MKKACLFLAFLLSASACVFAKAADEGMASERLHLPAAGKTKGILVFNHDCLPTHAPASVGLQSSALLRKMLLEHGIGYVECQPPVPEDVMQRVGGLKSMLEQVRKQRGDVPVGVMGRGFVEVMAAQDGGADFLVSLPSTLDSMADRVNFSSPETIRSLLLAYRALVGAQEDTACCYQGVRHSCLPLDSLGMLRHLAGSLADAGRMMASCGGQDSAAVARKMEAFVDERWQGTRFLADFTNEVLWEKLKKGVKNVPFPQHVERTGFERRDVVSNFLYFMVYHPIFLDGSARHLWCWNPQGAFSQVRIPTFLVPVSESPEENERLWAKARGLKGDERESLLDLCSASEDSLRISEVAQWESRCSDKYMSSGR